MKTFKLNLELTEHEVKELRVCHKEIMALIYDGRCSEMLDRGLNILGLEQILNTLIKELPRSYKLGDIFVGGDKKQYKIIGVYDNGFVTKVAALCLEGNTIGVILDDIDTLIGAYAVQD
jgi:hypothetical protein